MEKRKKRKKLATNADTKLFCRLWKFSGKEKDEKEAMST